MNQYPIEIPDKVKEFWSKDHAHRLSEGMFQKVREGNFPGCAPVGYLNVREKDGTPRIVIDPVKGLLVQEAFRLAAEGRLSLRNILKMLTEEGLVSRNEKSIGISGVLPHDPESVLYRQDAISGRGGTGEAPGVGQGRGLPARGGSHGSQGKAPKAPVSHGRT